MYTFSSAFIKKIETFLTKLIGIGDHNLHFEIPFLFFYFILFIFLVSINVSE